MWSWAGVEGAFGHRGLLLAVGLQVGLVLGFEPQSVPVVAAGCVSHGGCYLLISSQNPQTEITEKLTLYIPSCSWLGNFNCNTTIWCLLTNFDNTGEIHLSSLLLAPATSRCTQNWGYFLGPLMTLFFLSRAWEETPGVDFSCVLDDDSSWHWSSLLSALVLVVGGCSTHYIHSM